MFTTVFIKKFILKFLENLLEGNIVYKFIKIINLQNFLYICYLKYLVNIPIFHKFYVETEDICRPTDDFYGTCFHLQRTSPKTLTEFKIKT